MSARTDAVPLILIVDDNDAGRFGRTHYVRRAGYRIAEAATGRDAIRLAAELRPDIAILDVNLPDINGLDVCRQLKTGDITPPMHVLQISGTAISDTDRARGLTAGADAYLTEPVSPEVLLATLEAILRIRRTEQALEAALANERHARDEAERADRFKDEFLATLSHELRTPLSAMVGWVWQLRHGITDEPARQRALDGLERSTQMQIRMINDLLDVSRIGRGRLDVDLAPVDLADVVNAAVESVQAGLRVRQLAITVSTTPVAIMGDAARLQQIVGNLLTNAVKFSLQNGQIHVSLTSTGGEAVIRVQDTGIGIDRALLPHVFDQFRQGDGGFARRHAGLGLGLAIVRELVTLHGGAVIAESEGPGCGATFTVRLPLAGASPREQPAPGEPVGQPLRGVRVLVVDDDYDSRAWLSRLVEVGGGSAVPASSVQGAMEVLDGQTIDLVVSDIGMPGQDGLALVEMLRVRAAGVPAVAVTAFAAADEKRRILAAGFVEYFSKPIEPAAFLNRLAELHARTGQDGGGRGRSAAKPGQLTRPPEN
jgi:signal transduction histidine kinase